MLEKMQGAVQMGSTLVLWLLILLSVISIGIVVDRIIYFRRRRIDVRAIGKKLVELLRAKDLEGARSMLSRSKSVEAEILRDSLGWYPEGPDAFAEVLQSGIKDRRGEFESGLLFLGTLANNSPFIGLFGTVLGIITAFKELGNAQAGAMGNVMSGIAEALISTAVGILVALPAVVAFNYFQKKSLAVEDNVMTLGGQVLALLRSVPHAHAHDANGATSAAAPVSHAHHRDEVQA